MDCTVCGEGHCGEEGSECTNCYEGTYIPAFKGRIIYSATTNCFVFPDDVDTTWCYSNYSTMLIPTSSEQYVISDGQYLFGTSLHGTARGMELSRKHTIKDLWWNQLDKYSGECISCGKPGRNGDFCTYCPCGPIEEIMVTQLAICLVCQNLGVREMKCTNGCWVPSKCVPVPKTPVTCKVCKAEYKDEPGSICSWCKTGKMHPSFKGRINYNHATKMFDYPDD
jgi:hypothetical protein